MNLNKMAEEKYPDTIFRKDMDFEISRIWVVIQLREAYIAGLSDSGLVKALEYWKQRCEAAEKVLDNQVKAVWEKEKISMKQVNEDFKNWQSLKVKALAGINEQTNKKEV